jgi:glutathione peroxidase
MTTVHDFRVKTIDGAERALSDYAGKALLVVNVASRCGLTPQYTALEALYREEKARGLEVLGFPCNQFGAQEPGTEAEIKTFCSTKYDVTFPLFAKIDVNGASAHPLYAFLTAEATQPDGPGKVGWNFAKFLVGKDGKVLARFAPTEDPAGAKIRAAITAALG